MSVILTLNEYGNKISFRHEVKGYICGKTMLIKEAVDNIVIVPVMIVTHEAVTFLDICVTFLLIHI